MSQTHKPTIDKSDSWQMFNRIARRYDALNRILSLGLDIKWRAALKQHMPSATSLRLLDLATGTGDVVLTLLRTTPSIQDAVGIDKAEQMIDLAKAKMERAGLTSRLHLRTGDAAAIPYPDRSFDVVTIAFGIRNMPNPVTVLQEMFRVLKRQGRVVILEFSQPASPVLRVGHTFYLSTIVPLIGGLLSGDAKAYRYLHRTIAEFPYGETFAHYLRQVGFRQVNLSPLCGGIATIYTAEKTDTP